VLITLTVGVVIATLGVGAIDSLAVFFVPANLHVTASWLGPLIAAFGAGAIAGALLTGPVARSMPPARIFWLGLVLSGTGLVGFSRSTQLQAAIGILCLRRHQRDGEHHDHSAAAGSDTAAPARPGQCRDQPGQHLASILSMAAAGFLASTALRFP
jgi:hypothetical protein